jgi:hypothetical protein
MDRMKKKKKNKNVWKLVGVSQGKIRGDII